MSDIRKWDEVNGVDEDPGHLAAFLESATDAYAIFSSGTRTIPSMSGSSPIPASSGRARSRTSTTMRWSTTGTSRRRPTRRRR